MLMLLLLGVLLLYFVVLIVIACASLRPARSPIFLSPAALGYEVEELEFECDGVKLRGWWMPHPSPRAVAIFCHGYVMNRAEGAGLAMSLHKEGVASLLFDFRGCGRSGDSKIGIGWPERNDVLAACRIAEAKAPGIPRVLVGSSMGSAAAAFAMADEPTAASAIVLDSCYSKLTAATLGWWEFLGGWPAKILFAPVILVAWPVAGFNPFRVDVAAAVSRIAAPILIIHGERDNLAPVHHAKRNYAAAAEPKELVLFPNSYHSEARWGEPKAYLDSVLDFLKRHLWEKKDSK